MPFTIGLDYGTGSVRAILVNTSTGEEVATSTFDYPLTTRYDEPDALVVFDNVLIPWERVFVNRDNAVGQRNRALGHNK